MERKHFLLTGGIGSGKSSVGRILASRGVCVVDADAVGHAVLEPDGEAFEDVSTAFPSVVVEGRIDRARLAEIVFADPARLRLLESLTHPAIRGRIERAVVECETQLVMVELPLATDFMGGGWLTVVVDAPEESRLQRLVARGMDPDDARQRMRSQPTRGEWTASADFVVDNSGDRKALEAEVDRLWDWLSQ